MHNENVPVALPMGIGPAINGLRNHSLRNKSMGAVTYAVEHALWQAEQARKDHHCEQRTTYRNDPNTQAQWIPQYYYPTWSPMIWIAPPPAVSYNRDGKKNPNAGTLMLALAVLFALGYSIWATFHFFRNLSRQPLPLFDKIFKTLLALSIVTVLALAGWYLGAFIAAGAVFKVLLAAKIIGATIGSILAYLGINSTVLQWAPLKPDPKAQQEVNALVQRFGAYAVHYQWEQATANDGYNGIWQTIQSYLTADNIMTFTGMLTLITGIALLSLSWLVFGILSASGIALIITGQLCRLLPRSRTASTSNPPIAAERVSNDIPLAVPAPQPRRAQAVHPDTPSGLPIARLANENTTAVFE